MPPPTIRNGQAPDDNASASGSILGSFRNLLGQRKGQGTSKAASSPSVDTNSALDYLNTNPTRSGKTPLTRYITEPANATQARQYTHGNGAQSEHLTGPPQLEALVQRLGTDYGTKERCKAASSLIEIMRQYELDNVSTIWHQAEDLLDQAPNSTAFDTGFQLFKACLVCDGLQTSDKRLLFDTVAKQLLQYPDACIRCLGLLTNQGRDFEGLDLTRVVNILVKLMTTSYEAVVTARKQIKSRKAGSFAAEYDRLTVVFHYMNESVKFSATLFTESQLAALLDDLIHICLRTSQAPILEEAIEFFGTVVTYAVMPISKFRQLVQVVCTVYGSTDSGTDQLNPATKRLVWKLLVSHLGSRAIDSMLEMIVDPNQNVTGMRGSVQLLREALVANEEEVIARPPLFSVLSAIQAALEADIVTIKTEVDILVLLRDVLGNALLLASLFEEHTWAVFTDVLDSCAYGEAIATSDNLDTSQDVQECATALQQVRDALLSLATPISSRTDNKEGEDSSKVDNDRVRSIMTVLLRLARFLDDHHLDKVIAYHTTERLHLGPQAAWFKTCRHLRKGILEDDLRPLEIRLAALGLLNEAYSTAIAFSLRESESLLKSLMKNFKSTTNSVLLRSLAEMVVDVAAWTDNADLFEAIVDNLHAVLKGSPKGATPTESPNIWSSYLAAQPATNLVLPEETWSLVIAKALVRIFLRTLNKSFTKTNKLYTTLLEIARSSSPPPEARVAALKALVRIRSDINYAIFIVPKTENQSLAAALCRTADSAPAFDASYANSPVTKAVKTDDQAAKRKLPGSTSNNSSVSRTNSVAGRGHSTTTSRITRPTPPLWMYPGPKGLPEDPSPHSSHLVFSHLDDINDSEPTNINTVGALDIAAWMDVVLDLLNSTTLDWEIFSYLIVHLGAQLSNHSLFKDSIRQIKILRKLVCERVGQRNFMEPPSFSNLKKSDAAVCFYQILTLLIGYAEHFQREEEQDPIVKAFAVGLGSHDRTSEMCIHGLSICCHEMPSLIRRHLNTTLQQMARIITQSNIAAPILEFLATVARLPDLFRNFTEDDFRTVFGLCFRYLQAVREKSEQSAIHSSSRANKAGASARTSRDMSNSVEGTSYGSSLGDILPQYVHALAYHVMTFWFMALRLQERPGQINHIIKNLTLTDEKGNDIMEEHGQVTVDMMYRVAFSDRDETMPDANFALPSDGHVASKSYMVGTSILTIETAGRTGVSQLTTRRPSGTIYSTFKPQVIPTPRHQAPVTTGLAADAIYSEDYVGVMPEHVMQLMFSPYTVLRYGSSNAAPIPLPDDEITKRAIRLFDMTPALDGHRVGIMYVGEGQTSETQILANVMGSADYMEFLNGIGVLTELKGATFNTQGLNRELDTDGKFTYCWRDRVTELVFHVPTMMPTNLDVYPQCENKKLHTGNDYVKIIFNNSGLPFDFDTFPSAFNYVNIVVTPEARASFVETRIYAKGQALVEKYYKVTVMTKKGLPNISPAAETKIISGTSLPAFVRLLALNASVFSQVWTETLKGGEYVSSWLARLRVIDRLRAKHAPISKAAEGQAAVSQEAPLVPRGSLQMAAQEPQRGSTLFRRMSVATLFSDNSSASNNANRLSGLSASGDADRTSSAGSLER